MIEGIHQCPFVAKLDYYLSRSCQMSSDRSTLDTRRSLQNNELELRALSRRRKIRIRSLEAAICLNLHTGSVGILLRENCFPSQPTEACNAAIGRWLLPSRMVVLVQAPLLIHIQA